MKYDVVIIGGGITGTGIAHELAKYQLKTILLESGTDVAFSATKQNGGVIHPGYDPHPRSEERRVGKECRSRWSPYH